MSEDVWGERDTTPEAIAAALRNLLRERHATNEALAPARVLNLIVVVDRAWKGEIANRLGRVGRYHASRTILCAVQEGQRTLDAVAVLSYDESPGGTLSVMHEKVEIDIGPEHLEGLDTIVDPILVSELPTMLWAPHGHQVATPRLLEMLEVVLLDSDAEGEETGWLERAESCLEAVYVVDLAWLRTTPWRERLAASFDLPNRRPALHALERVAVRHHRSSAASAELLTGWLASRLHWNGRHAEVECVPVEQDAPGLAGVTVAWGGGHSLSLDRGRGGLTAREQAPGERERVWQVLGASRGEGGILGEGVRQALLRDPTYGPALQAAKELSRA